MTLQERYSNLAAAVEVMREAQRKHLAFATRTRETLANKRKCEEAVERMLEDYRKSNPQQRIFE